MTEIAVVFKRAPNLLFRDHSEDDFGQNAVVKVPDGPDARAISALIMAAFDGLQIQWLLDPTVDMAETLAVLNPLIGNAAATPAQRGDAATGETGVLASGANTAPSA